LALLALTGLVPAQVEVIAESWTTDAVERASGGPSVLLRYRAGAADRAIRSAEAGTQNSIYLPEEMDENERQSLAGLKLALPEPPPAGTGALIAIPQVAEYASAGWRAEAKALRWADGSTASGEPVAGGVEVRPIRIGTLALLHVIIQDDALLAAGDGRRAAEVEIALVAMAGRTDRSAKGNGTASTQIAYSPVSTYPELERLLQASTLNPSVIDQVALRSLPEPANAARATEFSLPNLLGQLRLRYATGDEIIRVPLATLGIAADKLPESAFRHHGQSLPVALDGSDVWFYAPRRQTQQDRTDSVFFKSTRSAEVASPPMATRPAFETLTPQGTEVELLRTRRFDRPAWHHRSAPVPAREKFFLHRVRQGETLNVTLGVHDVLTTTSIHASMEVVGVTSITSWYPDHLADFTLAGVTASRAEFDGRTVVSYDYTYELPALPVGPNLAFSHALPGGSVECPGGSPCNGVGGDTQVLRAVTLTWTGKPRSPDGRKGLLEIPAAAMPSRVTLGGFAAATPSSDFVVLDVTDPHVPIRLTGVATFADDNGGTAVEFEVPAVGGKFHVQLLSQTGVLIDALAPPALPALPQGGEPLRGIFVRPAELALALQPLVAARGAGYIELDPQMAYDHFNGGQESAEAVRDMIAFMIGQATLRAPVPYVLLVGHGSLDPKNYLGTITSTPQVPVFVSLASQAAFDYEGVTDSPYELLEGSDDFPDVILGRIPARNPTQLSVAVARQLRHDAIADTLIADTRSAVFVGGNESIFHAIMPIWTTLWSPAGHGSTTILVPLGSSNAVTETLQLRSLMTAGPSGVALAMYIGHGQTTAWGSRMLREVDLPLADTYDKWPVLAAFNCLNADFGNTTGTCLGETSLFITATGFPERPIGAIANISPANTEFLFEQQALSEELLALFSLGEPLRPRTVGEFMMRGRIDYLTIYPFWKGVEEKYVLLGDPLATMTVDPPLPPSASVEGWSRYSEEVPLP